MDKRKIRLINPVGESPDEQNKVAAPLGDLNGKRIGLRTDDIWRSFDIFTSRIQELLKQKSCGM